MDIKLGFDRVFEGRKASTFTQTVGGRYVLVGDVPEGVWMMWTDAQGCPLATRTYDTPEEDSGEFEILAKDDGGVVVLGTGFLGAWLLSVDADGDVCWLRYRDAYPRDFYVRYAHSLIRTSGGGYAWVTEPFNRTLRGGRRLPAYVHVVDEQGRTVWQRAYTTEVPDALKPGAPRLRAIVQLDDGGFMLAGHIRGGDAPYLTRPYPLWAVRTNAEGEKIDDAVFGSTPSGNTEWVNSAVRTADGGIAITGSENVQRPYQGRFMFRTLNTDLELDVDRTYNPRGCDQPIDAWAGDLVRVTDGGFVLSGTSVRCESESVNGTVGQLIGLAPDGTVRWTYSYPEEVSESDLVCYPEGGECYSLTHFNEVVQADDGGITTLGSSSKGALLVKVTPEKSC